MTRRKLTSKFKTRVVLECLKERHSLSELAQRYEIHPNQISAWKRAFLQGSEDVFSKGKKSVKSEADQEKDRLLKAMGQLKVENDFLRDALR